MGRSKEWSKYMFRGKKVLSPATKHKVETLVHRNVETCADTKAASAYVLSRVRPAAKRAAPKWLLKQVEDYAQDLQARRRNSCK